MDIQKILDLMIEENASDIFVRVNGQLRARVASHVVPLGKITLTLSDVEKIIDTVTNEEEKLKLKEHKACEFTYWYKENWRFRFGVFYQRNTPSIVVRKIDLRIPGFKDLGLPEKILEGFCRQRRGIILLTGITGSGKSTTIASMMQYINNNFGRHMLTIEEPIEFTFKDNKSVINQREIGTDVEGYQQALRQFALHSPDVLYVGNIRDAETCYAALTAAETGVLVFSTIHTVNASSTIERIINFFDPYQHNLIMDQLSTLLKGVLSQRLLPCANGKGLVAAYEAMALSPSVSRLIRENKIWEIPKYIASGDIYGMKTFHQSLIELIEAKKVTAKVALEYADKREELEMELRNKGLL